MNDKSDRTGRDVASDAAACARSLVTLWVAGPAAGLFDGHGTHGERRPLAVAGQGEHSSLTVPSRRQ
jgi:hypothetical protein